MSAAADHAEYLRPTQFIDADHPAVSDFASSVARDHPTDRGKAVALFQAVRDGIRYDPYRIDLRPEALSASAVLAKGYGFCVSKAILLAATARALGIPSRPGFADVKNHITTEKLKRLMRTDLFVFHGYTELLLEGSWVKATPAFNSSLCERCNVEPLSFDGLHDSMLQQFDFQGNLYMEYVRDHGQFSDLPLDRMLAAFREHYPSLMAEGAHFVETDFEDDAAAERGGG